MVKAGGPGGGRLAAFALPGVEPQMVMIAAGRDEGCAWAAGGQRKTQDAAIEIERPLEIGHLQVHVADAHASVDGGKAQLFLGHFGGFRHWAIPGWLAGYS